MLNVVPINRCLDSFVDMVRSYHHLQSAKTSSSKKRFDAIDGEFC